MPELGHESQKKDDGRRAGAADVSTRLFRMRADADILARHECRLLKTEGLRHDSGIVVDNVADTAAYPQASSVYFTFVKNSVSAAQCNGATGVGCAVKLTQSGLQ